MVSGATVQRGSARRLRALRDAPPVLKKNAPKAPSSCQTPHTTAAWGAPEGSTVPTQ